MAYIVMAVHAVYSYGLYSNGLHLPQNISTYYVVMAYKVVASIVMVFVAMICIVMAIYGLCSYGLHLCQNISTSCDLCLYLEARHQSCCTCRWVP